MLARKLIEKALNDIQVLRIGQEATPEYLDHGIETINSIFRKWGSAKLLHFYAAQVSKALTIGKSAYTIGNGVTNDINTVLPIGIESGFIRDSSNQDYPIRGVPLTEFNRISQKTSITGRPTCFFYNHAYPIGTITFWPVPDAAETLYLNLRQPFTAILPGEVDSDIALPDTYLFVLELELRIQLSKAYGQKIDVSDVAERNAAFDDLKIANSEPTQPIEFTEFVRWPRDLSSEIIFNQGL